MEEERSSHKAQTHNLISLLFRQHPCHMETIGYRDLLLHRGWICDKFIIKREKLMALFFLFSSISINLI